MKRVTLNGIQRVGLSQWKAREWWVQKKVYIWTREHGAWWRPGANGYTDKIDNAGVWDFADAYDITKHCGPEKQIVFFSLPSA